MKSLMFYIPFLFCISSFAQTESVREFNVEQAEFSPSHFQSPTSALLTVNYQNSEVSLHVIQAMPPCPTGQVCAQVMPAPFDLTLPFQSIQKDNCGVFHVVAEKDFRPINGLLYRIEMKDTTESACSPLEPSLANYQTAPKNRAGKGNKHISYMRIKPRAKSSRLEILSLVRGQFLKGFPDYQTPGPGKLLLRENKVELQIQVYMNCTHRICPRIMPQPLLVEAPIVQVENIECGLMTTAIKDHRKKSGSYVEIRVKDYSQSKCHFLAKPTTDVEYKGTYTRGDHTYEYEAIFSFDRK